MVITLYKRADYINFASTNHFYVYGGSFFKLYICIYFKWIYVYMNVCYIYIYLFTYKFNFIPVSHLKDFEAITIINIISTKCRYELRRIFGSVSTSKRSYF